MISLCQFEVEDVGLRLRINEIESLLNSDYFLAGLFLDFAAKFESSDYELITDVQAAINLQYSQEIWDMEEPWPFQYFASELEDAESEAINYAEYPELKNERLQKAWQHNLNGDFTKSFIDFVRNKLDAIRHVPSLNDKNIDFIDGLIGEIANLVYCQFHSLINVALIRDYRKSSFYSAMLDIYEQGAIPCGWMGAIPYLNGGDPRKCFAVLVSVK